MPSALTRHPGRIALALALIVLLAGGIWLVRAQRIEVGTIDDQETRTVEAGDVTAKVTPLSLDASGARFDVVLDTHTGGLDVDVARAGQLRINGTPVARGSWSGTEPGGHHREGVLSYATPIPSGANVELRISELPQDVVVTWTAP